MTARQYTNLQGSRISCGYVDFLAKIFLILYPSLENLISRITITKTKTNQTLVKGVSLVLVLLINVSLLMFYRNVTLPTPEHLLESQNITSTLVKTLLVTSWRSGSTLIGELLNSNTGKQIWFSEARFSFLNTFYYIFSFTI